MVAFKQKKNRVLFVIDTAKVNCKCYSACYQSSARYYPEGSKFLTPKAKNWNILVVKRYFFE